jgi:hypothetical protein
MRIYLTIEGYDSEKVKRIERIDMTCCSPDKSYDNVVKSYCRNCSKLALWSNFKQGSFITIINVQVDENALSGLKFQC